MDVTHRYVETNGIRMHIAEAGQGPTVLLCHGFPECWYSWRHQLQALSDAGFHVVAPDQRGYGGTDKPHPVESYTMMHLVGDLVGLLDALGVSSATIVGHDWGAIVAWNAALIRPDRFHAIAALSVPILQRAPALPTTLLPRTETEEFYTLYFQRPGRAEADFDPDPRETVRNFMLFSSGTNVPEPRTIGSGGVNMMPSSGGYFSKRPKDLPPNPGISETDLDIYGEAFRDGFRGPLNWYRNIDRNWETLAPYIGAKWAVPALYIVGDRDVVLAFRGMDKNLAALPRLVPQLRETIVLPGCGHWTQQERPEEVNAALIEFQRSLPSEAR
jgi:pimeloyl-ACP methyl ester carboxylesterase